MSAVEGGQVTIDLGKSMSTPTEHVDLTLSIMSGMAQLQHVSR